jgi:aminopeptidase C
MKILKEIEDIKFTDGISEPIVMASNAGWYVGRICNTEGFLEPYDRMTQYFLTSREAQIKLNTPVQDGGFWGMKS